MELQVLKPLRDMLHSVTALSISCSLELLERTYHNITADDEAFRPSGQNLVIPVTSKLGSQHIYIYQE